MQSKTIKNIPGTHESTTVTAWKLNNGFKTDFQGACSEVIIDQKKKPTVTVSAARSRLYLLVFGIYEIRSEDPTMVIPPIKNIKAELLPEELEQRLAVVRGMEADVADYIYEEIAEINTSKQSEAEREEIEKK